MAGWLDEIAQWPVDLTRWLTFFEYRSPSTLSRIENVVPFHQGIKSVLEDPALVEILGELMGEPALLYKDRVNFKPPSGGPHEAHQDGVAFEVGQRSQFGSADAQYLSVLIAVDLATVGNGCLEIAVGWPLDRIEILPMEFPDQARPNYSTMSQESEDQLNWRPIEAEPGDVLIFTERLPHRSRGNTSTSSRRILYGVYSPSSEGDRRSQYFDEKRRNINHARYMIGNPHAAIEPMS